MKFFQTNQKYEVGLLLRYHNKVVKQKHKICKTTVYMLTISSTPKMHNKWYNELKLWLNTPKKLLNCLPCKLVLYLTITYTVGTVL